jgi:hypothetical protein
VTGNKDSITGDNITGSEESNIVNERVLDVDDAFNSGANSLDATFFLLIVKNAELSFFLPIIEDETGHESTFLQPDKTLHWGSFAKTQKKRIA